MQSTETDRRLRSFRIRFRAAGQLRDTRCMSKWSRICQAVTPVVLGLQVALLCSAGAVRPSLIVFLYLSFSYIMLI